MNPLRAHHVRALLPGVLLFSVLLSGTASARRVPPQEDTGTPVEEPVASERPVVDGELEPHRRDLLVLAFECVSGMPLDPHVKNMARFQETVVEAALELEQPTLVAAWVDRVPNWRRGAIYADLAFHGASHGQTAQVRGWLERAAEIAMSETDAEVQKWRRDAVKVRIARAQAVLGDLQLARELEKGVVDSEVGKVDAVLALHATPEQFDVEFARLKAVLDSQNFDQMLVALDTCVELHDRFHADDERRTRLETTVREAYAKLPLKLRLDLLLGMTENALDHGQPKLALHHLDEALGLVDTNRYLPQDEVALRGRMAGLRWLAGDRDKAERELAIALELYENLFEQITDIHRADTLRPVAVALHRMGRDDQALACFRRVVDLGQLNPNSRPRCEDLSLTCIAMARCGFQPDEALLAHMREVAAGFGDPW